MHRPTLLMLLALVAPFTQAANFPAPTGAATVQKFPYSMIGQLSFSSAGDVFVGSGTVIQPRGVLTAGHNVYDPDGGWSTNVVFKRGHYDETNLSVRTASRLYVLAGYQENADFYGGDSSRAFARDTGGLTFVKVLAGGSFLGWSTNLNLLTGNGQKLALGYGAEEHSGEQLLSVRAASPFQSSYQAHFDSRGTAIEAGMSGGPVITRMANGNRAVSGTIVSGTDAPYYGGIRVIDETVSSFISKYLSQPQ